MRKTTVFFPLSNKDLVTVGKKEFLAIGSETTIAASIVR